MKRAIGHVDGPRVVVGVEQRLVVGWTPCNQGFWMLGPKADERV